MEVDLLLKNACIITMDSGKRIINNGGVAIFGDTILAIDSSKEIEKQYRSHKIIDVKGKYLFPGFISTHTHLFQTLLKGLGRDKLLLDWLNSSVRRALHLYDEEAMHYAALAGLIEAVRTGTTTVTDFQYCHPGKGFDIPVIEAYEKLGVRAVISKAHTDVSAFPREFACDYVETEDDYFHELADLCLKYKDNQLINLAMSPGAIWDHSRDGFLQTREMADKYKLIITMHLVETLDDDEFCRSKWGMRTIPFLEDCGVFGPDFVAVHSIHLIEEDIQTFREYGVSVSHCPVSNMLLASGTAPIPRLMDEGIRISLACDGAASNDTQNMLEVLKITALQHKLATGDATVVTAPEVLEMATLGGAGALQMEEEIGSIEIGKKADMFVYNPLVSGSAPVHDPVSAIVYSSSPLNIETTIIGGRVVLENGTITGVDEIETLLKTQNIASSLAVKAGLGNSQWNQKVQALDR